MKIQTYLAAALRTATGATHRLLQAIRLSVSFFLRTAGSVARAVWFSPRLRAALRPAASLIRTAAVATGVALASAAALRATTQTLLPTEIGVVQKDWGNGAGIVPEDLAPSKRFIIPGRATLHRLNRRIHFVRFGMESEGNDHPSLELRTPDDLEVRIGASISYRIIEGEAHRIVEDGIRSTYQDLARAAVERVLLDALGSLRRVQWSSLEAREAAREAALAEIRQALAPFHLEPLSLHLSSTWFPPEFEVEVMEQKLLEQRILTDAMLARRDERNYERLTEVESIQSAEASRAAALDLEIEMERADLNAKVRELRSATTEYTFERKTESDNLYEKALTIGRLDVDRAEALREKLLNQALESEGGRVMIAREAASNLKFKSIKLDANNPDVPSVLDLDALIELLLGKEGT